MSLFSPIQFFADQVTYSLLKLAKGSYLGSCLNFFIFDILKIFILLVIINYFMAIVRYFLPVEKIRKILTLRKWYGLDYLLAALFGVVTPFCSCSSIPLFIGFVSAGIPLGVTFAFLITSPLVNEASLAIFPAIFGFRITLVYNLVGVFIGIVGGFLIQKLKMEKYIDQSFLKVGKLSGLDSKKGQIKLSQLLKQWWGEGWEISKSVMPYVVLGVGLGALVHGLVPANFFEKYLSSNSWWSVPLAVIFGVPLYANSVSIIPIIEALVGKGVPLGTALAFMTATVTLSIPEALILKRVMKLPLLLTFFGITSLGIVFLGYFFNWLY